METRIKIRRQTAGAVGSKEISIFLDFTENKKYSIDTRIKMNFTILRFDSLDSTNTEAINQAKRGADEGLCIIADLQTAGRGRHGREWISEKDAGLYFSIVLRPVIETRFLPLITLMTAVAVADTLENLYALKPDIKWVNDIHIGEKKICGILAEMTETTNGRAVIVGIGINLRSSNFPADISGIATSIEAETGVKTDREELLQKLTHFLNYFYEILQSENGEKKYSLKNGKSVHPTHSEKPLKSRLKMK